MDRRTVTATGTALVGVLALALAAATLSATVQRRGGGASDLDGSGSTGGWWLRLPELPLGERARGLLLVALLLVVFVVAGLLLYGGSRGRKPGRLDIDLDVDLDYRKRGIQLLALLVIVGLLVVFLAAVLTGALAPGLSRPGADAGGPGGPGETGPGPVFVPAVLALVLVVALAAVTVLVVRSRRRDGSARSREPETPGEDEPDPATVARAAGEAADRIEDGRAVENEVYRAWREMTELLSLPSSGTRTPGEFAAAAVDAGMAPDDVAELTRLFEDVRYGDDEPTPETERRARAVFRRIESAYGDSRDGNGDESS